MFPAAYAPDGRQAGGSDRGGAAIGDPVSRFWYRRSSLAPVGGHRALNRAAPPQVPSIRAGATMGRLIKTHLARLVTLTAASYHFAAAAMSFIWPKVFFDFVSKRLDILVAPTPVLQLLNLLLAALVLLWEWPLPALAAWPLRRSIRARLAALPLVAAAAVLLYPGTDPTLYYCIAFGLYVWAQREGEVVPAQPWGPALDALYSSTCLVSSNP